MPNEFSTLIAELKEHVLYLQELGVENFSVDLPSIDSSKFKIQSSKSEISREKLERFIPTDEILSKISETQPKTVNTQANQTRRNLLESTKLSLIRVLSQVRLRRICATR